MRAVDEWNEGQDELQEDESILTPPLSQPSPQSSEGPPPYSSLVLPSVNPAPFLINLYSSSSPPSYRDVFQSSLDVRTILAARETDVI